MKALVDRLRTPQRADMAHVNTKKEVAQLSPETIKMLIDQSHKVKKQSLQQIQGGICSPDRGQPCDDR